MLILPFPLDKSVRSAGADSVAAFSAMVTTPGSSVSGISLRPWLGMCC